jgi:spore germination cell wall hydrolase CwlJ-like protein
MTDAALRLRKAQPPAHNRRTLAWLAAIVVLVSLLTSEMVWARFLNIVGAEEGQFSEIASQAPISEQEKELLIKLTDTIGPTGALSPTDAIVRNEAIPFTQTLIATAKPFQALNLSDGTALTALQCLTQAVYFEAGFEPLEGRKAVAQVVLNRVMHPAFPKSVCGVVYQGVNRPVCQFSFTCDGSLNRRPNPSAWQEAAAVARAALGGYVETAVGYSTHYHANYVSPYWAPRLVKIAQIGAHIFYRWPGGWGMPGAFSGRYAGREAIPALLPRSLVVKRNDDVDAQTRTLAEGRLPANLVPINHSESDVGGRLDVSKGWTASIPEPEETHVASSVIARQQAGEYEAATTRSGI